MTQPVETFTVYVAGLPTATTPLTGADFLVVSQSGVTKKAPALTVYPLGANTTVTTGFTAGQFLYSDGTKLQAGTFSTGLSFTTGTLKTVLTGNAVATSGFTAGQFLYSDGTLLQAGTFGSGLTFSAGTLTVSMGLTVNTTTVSGGSAGNLLYTDGSKLQATGGVTYSATPQAITIASIANPSASTLTLTGATALTTSQPVLNITQTWNAGGVTFTGVLLNITNTASAAASRFLDIQSSGQFITRFQLLQVDAGANGTGGSIDFFSTSSTLEGGFISGCAASTINFGVGAVSYISMLFNVAAGRFTLASAMGIKWDSNTSGLLGGVDTGISRNAAGVVEVNSGTAGTFRDLIIRDAFTNDATFFIRTKTTLTNSAAAQAGTLTNAPTAGNPTKWIGIDDNGVTRQIPAW